MTKTRGTTRRAVLLVLLCLFVMGTLTLGTFSVQAAEAVHHDDFTVLSSTQGSLATGNYYLADDLTLTGTMTIPTGADVVLCIAGRVLSGAGLLQVPMFEVSGTLTICNCTTRGSVNGGSEMNGVVTVKNGGALTLDGLSIAECSSHANGGVVFAEANTTVTLSNTTIYHAIAQNGGAVYTSGTLLVDENSSLTTCEATSGGAIYATAGAMVTFAGELYDCTASEAGGGVYLAGGTLSLQETAAVEKCTATRGGGIYVASGAGATLAGELYNCTASEAGGGVYLAGTLSLQETAAVEKCTATRGGGIYVATGAEATLAGATLSQNKATADGGGVYVAGGTATLSATRLTDNAATANGGAIYVAGGTLATSGTVRITDNTAQNGAAIALVGGTVSVEATRIQDNQAEQGGGIYVTGGNLSLGNGTVIQNNQATVQGGGLWTSASVVLGENVNITNNTCTVAPYRNAVLTGTAVFTVQGALTDTKVGVFFPFAADHEKVLTAGFAANNADATADAFFLCDETNALFADLVLSGGEVVLRKITYTAELASGTYFGMDYVGGALGNLLDHITIYRKIGNAARVAVEKTETYGLSGAVDYAAEGSVFTMKLGKTEVCDLVVYFTHKLELVDFADATYNGAMQTVFTVWCDGVARNKAWFEDEVRAVLGVTLSGNTQKNARNYYTVTATSTSTTDANGERYAWASAAAKSAKWTILPFELTAAHVTFTGATYYKYDNQTHAFEIVVRALGSTLTSADYTVSGNSGKDYREGGYTAVVTGKGNFTGTVSKTFYIQKIKYDMSGISFAGQTFVYDGKPHTVTITGTLPTGLDGVRVQVTYTTQDGGTNVSVTNVSDGTKTIVATFTSTSINYETPTPATLSAQIRITPATYDISGVTFTGKQFVYDGKPHTVTVSGTIPSLDGVPVEVTYTTQGGGTNVSVTNVSDGTKTIVATFVSNSANYVFATNPTTMSAQISVKAATYNMSGVSFTGQQFVYDGQPHTVTIAGTLPTGADGITVTVSYNDVSVTNVADGTKTVVATFASTSTNYVFAAKTMQANISVTPVVLTEAHVKFGTTTFAFDNTERVVAVTVTVPNLSLVEGTDYTVAGNKATNCKADGYTATVTGKGNFAGTVSTTWEITPLTYDMSEVLFADGVYVRTGRAFSLAVTGTLPTGLDGVTVKVTYENNGQSAPGVYEIIAHFTGSANYLPIADMTATLTVRADKVEASLPETDSTAPHVILQSATGFAPDRILSVSAVPASAYPKVSDILFIYRVELEGPSGSGTDGAAKVMLLIPEVVADEEKEFLIRQNVDGKVVEVPFEIVGGGQYAMVEVETLGDFFFVEDGGMSAGVFVAIGAAVVVAVGVALMGGGKKGGKSAPAKDAKTGGTGATTSAQAATKTDAQASGGAATAPAQAQPSTPTAAEKPQNGNPPANGQ